MDLRRNIEKLHGAVTSIEAAIRETGDQPYIRRRTLDTFKVAKGSLLEALTDIEKELTAHATLAEPLAASANQK
jgi:hypothetical protein